MVYWFFTEGDALAVVHAPSIMSAPLLARPTIYYRDCAAARAAGAAPLSSLNPGYRPALDRDRDGIACEPYHGP